MDTRTELLLRALEELLADPDWHLSERIEERLRLREFERRLMLWDWRSEELPGGFESGDTSCLVEYGAVACNASNCSQDSWVMPTITEGVIKHLLEDLKFRRELEDEDQRRWEAFTLRLLAWDGESEELSPPFHELVLLAKGVNMRYVRVPYMALIAGLVVISFLAGLWAANAQNEGVVEITKSEAEAGYWVLTLKTKGTGGAFLHNTGTGEVRIVDGGKVKVVGLE